MTTVDEITLALRVTNTLLLADAMGADPTLSTDRARVLRQLEVVEQQVRADSHE